MDIAGFVIAIIGLFFAFETPRRRFVAIFKRRSAAVDMQSFDLKSTVVVGCFPYPPLMDWGYGKNDTERISFSGPWILLIQELARRMDLTIELEEQSASAFKDPVAMHADVVLGLFKTDWRATVYDFSVPIHRIGLQGVCQSSLPSVTKEQLAKGDLSIVVQEGEVGWEYVKSDLKKAELKHNVCKVNSIATDEALDGLAAGRYQIAIADEVSCMQFLRGVGAAYPLRLAFNRPLQIFDCCLAVKKSLGWNMAEVNRQLAEIRNEHSFLEMEVASFRGFEHVIERCSLE